MDIFRDSTRKLFILHIGMGKCGSSSIQTFFNSWNGNTQGFRQEIEYIAYPDAIDLNPIIIDYLDIANVPPYIIEITKNQPLDTSVTQYLIQRVVNSQSKVIIASAEFIAWFLGDQESDAFVTALRHSLPDIIEIAVLCYFRQPASSRFLSLLQEDAKYNSKIALYVPDWPYSENVEVYKRWKQLCGVYNLSWKPRLFNKRSLIKEDVVADFLSSIEAMLGVKFLSLLNAVIVNKSIDPVVLLSIRRVISPYLNYLTFDRRSEIIEKLSILATQYLYDKGCTLQKWCLHPALEQHINYVCQEEEELCFENYQVMKTHQSDDILQDRLTLDSSLPPGIIRQNGYLTGELEAFLWGIDEAVVEDLTLYLETAIIEMASYWYVGCPLTFVID